VQESGPAGAQLREQDSEREGAKEEAGEQDNGSLGGGKARWRRAAPGGVGERRPGLD